MTPNTQEFLDARTEERLADAHAAALGEDGPLLLGMLLTNQNNANAANGGNANNSILDPSRVTLELASPAAEAVEPEYAMDDTPLLLGMLLTNQNNANAANGGNANNSILNPSSLVLELSSQAQSFTVKEVESQYTTDDLLLGMLLTNQNNANAANGGNANNSVLGASHVALELASQAHTSTVEEAGSQHSDYTPLLLGTENVEYSDGALTPLLLGMLLTNQNNANAANGGTANNSVLRTSQGALELILKPQEIAVESEHSISNMGLLLTNQNNANAANGGNANNSVLSPALPGVEMEVFPNGTLSDRKDTNPILKLRGFDPKEKRSEVSTDDLQFWRDNGYLVIPNVIATTTCSVLVDLVKDIAARLFSEKEDVIVHSYDPNGDDKFVSPCGKVLASLTQDANKSNIEPLQRLQRLGCGIHHKLPLFRKQILNKYNTTLAQQLGYKDPRITQSIVIVKPAHAGAKVVPHQDGGSSFTDPPSATTFWYALQDTTISNGCLEVAAGSHRTEPLQRRCRQNARGFVEFVTPEKKIFANVEGVVDSTLPIREEDGEYVYTKLEVKAGSLVLMHGNLLHKSDANRSDKHRVAFNFNVIEGGCRWKEDNYLQPCEGQAEFEKLRAIC